MKCSVCGSELPENSKFCVFCGNSVKAAAPEVPTYTPPAAPEVPSYVPPVYPSNQQPSYTPPSYASNRQPTYNPPSYNSQPVYPSYESAPTNETVVVSGKTPKGKKKKAKGGKGILVVAVIAAVLAVVIAAGLFVLNMPTIKLPMALANSLNAYAGIRDDIGLTKALAFLEKDPAYTATVSLTYKEINELIAGQAGVDLSQFEDAGVKFTTSMNLKKRIMGGTISLIQEDKDLVSANYGLDDDTAWVSVPALLKGSYGIKTTNLGEALVEMGAESNGLESLGFNFFDLLELLKTFEPSEDIVKAMEDAVKDLSKTIEIEADGSDEIKVNGKRNNCSVYNVVIPEDALEDYLDALEDPMKDYMKQVIGIYEDLFKAIGMPEEEIEMAMEEFEGVDFADVIDDMKEALSYLGDVELVIYVKGNYVMAVVYELEIDDQKMVITANMGGNDNYADDFSLVMEIEDIATIELSSSGNHSGKGGEFTDKTKIEITNLEYNESMRVTLESSYEPKAKSDNFSFEFKFSGPDSTMNMGLEAEGQLTLAKNSLDLQLEELSVSSMGMDFVTLGLGYSIKEYTDVQGASDVKLINKLSEEDIMEISQEATENAQTVVEDLMDAFPVLEDLLYGQPAVDPEYSYSDVPVPEGTMPSGY